MAYSSSSKENWLFDFYNQDSYLDFDGVDDYVDLGGTTSTSPISVAGNGSVAFWINFPVLGTQEDIFYNNSQDSNYSGILIAKGTDNKISITWGDASGAGESNRETMTSGTVLEANKWYFVVIGTNFESSLLDRNTNCKIWINGDASGNVTNSGTSSDNAPTYSPNGVAYIGRETVGTDAYGRFKMRSLAVYNVFLNQTNVNSLYNSGSYKNFSEVRPSDIVAYYKFNGNTTATDLINSQHGKVKGATYAGSNLHLSLDDTSYNDNFYYGVIKNKPSIRESIDLSSSKSKKSNISISIPDFVYKGSPISEELFGNGVYLNYDVKVYTKLQNDTPLLIGCFRLADISTNGDSLSLALNSFNPWDDITFPQERHSQQGIYAPTVYGDYEHGVFGGDASYMGVYPVPVLSANRNQYSCVVPRSYSANSSSHLHYYAGFNWFCAVNDGSHNHPATVVESGVNIFNSPTSHRANGYIRPQNSTHEATEGGTVTYFTDSLNIFTYNSFDGSADTSVFGTINVDDTSDNKYLVVKTPSRKFEVTLIKGFKVQYRVFLDDGAGEHQRYFLDAFSNEYDPSADDLRDSPLEKIISSTSISNHTIDFDSSPDNATLNNIDGCVCPDELLLKFDPSTQSGNTHEDHQLNIYDIQLLYEVRFNFNVDDGKKLEDLTYFYCGGNGLTHTITGLAGNDITEIHEAHLDLMSRYAGLDVQTNPATDIIGWGNGSNDNKLDHLKDWKIRYWELNPVSLNKSLEKLQYEGGFIFRFRRGNLNEPEYIFIKDSYSSTDVSITLSKHDLKDIQINPDSFSSIATKKNISYKKHPVPSNSNYAVLQNCSNATSKSEYVINSKENKKDIKLNAYVSPEIPASPSSTPNDDFYSYYNKIDGEIRLNISSQIINPKYFDINLGEIVQFSDMYPEKAFNKSFTNMIFMITSITRTVGVLKFTAREIGAI